MRVLLAEHDGDDEREAGERHKDDGRAGREPGGPPPRREQVRERKGRECRRAGATDQTACGSKAGMDVPPTWWKEDR